MFLKDVLDSCIFLLNRIYYYKEIVFDFMYFIEYVFGSFDNFIDLFFFDMINLEIFRNVVVIVVYNEN